MTEDAHAVAVLAALNAVLPDGYDAYDPGAVPDPLPEAFVEVTLTRRYAEAARMPGRQSRTGWRITTRSVGQSLTFNVRHLHDLTRQALEDARLVIDGVTTGPIQFETEEPIGPDGDDKKWFSGITSWTYTHGGHPHA